MYPTIRLISCIGVDIELAYLPHFLSYYIKLGVQPNHIHIILHAFAHESSNLTSAQSTLNHFGIENFEVWIGPHTSDKMWEKRRRLQSQMAKDQDWIVSADADEFHYYPVNLSAFLERCDKRNVDCLEGVFIDRVATDGSLATVGNQESIFSTFPIYAQVQGSITSFGKNHGWHGSVKLMAFKAQHYPARGGHHLIESNLDVNYLFGRHLADFPSISEPQFRRRVPLQVHHFKWSASLLEQMRSRINTPGASKAAAEYGKALLDYFDRHDGIDLSEVPIYKSRIHPSRYWRWRISYIRALHHTRRALRIPSQVAKKFLAFNG